MPHRNRIIRCWYTGRYIWYSEEGPGRAGAPPSPLLAVPNVTAHPFTASVLCTNHLLLYDDPLLCGFNVAIKGLKYYRIRSSTLLLFITLLSTSCLVLDVGDGVVAGSTVGRFIIT